MNENQLTGNMPDNWAVGPAFLNLADLQVRGWAAWCATAALMVCYCRCGSLCLRQCRRQTTQADARRMPAAAADGVQPLQRHLPRRLCGDQQLLHLSHVLVSACGGWEL